MGLTLPYPDDPDDLLDRFALRRHRYLPGVDSPEDDPGPPPCPGCGDESAPESLPETRMLRWGCCGHRERIDPYDNPSL